ncbi:MAG: hypothetical protein AAGB19_20025 [Cyanobacteria bacterium P01_F01_bin.3]
MDRLTLNQPSWDVAIEACLSIQLSLKEHKTTVTVSDTGVGIA